MSKKIMFATAKLKGEKERNIYCKDLDREDYDSKYKNHLTCINGCKAKIKFTQRKNNIKFFSTWNKEGKLHDKGCPYYVEYKGSKGREKLNAYYKNIELDDETIFNRLKNQYYKINKSYEGNELPSPQQGSRKVEQRGENNVDTFIDLDEGEKNYNSSNIRHKDANFVTQDDLGSRLSVYGKLHSVENGVNKDGTRYAYLNFKTENTSVNILFSEAFYSNEYANGINEFERFIENIKELVKNKEKDVIAIAYGEITKKKKRNTGVNVSVTNPKRILINNMSYKKILTLS
ncbi:hypothetical protein [Lysinibacillus sp. NPDC059133]|uniref:hypothetical protein n=1 Tax=Lysinibacillus sp. NPDC059133 TaxID=3346737 RepID=UPI003690B32C